MSIGNAFSGDAAIALLTVSHAALPGRSARGWATFMASPYGFTRALVLGVGEVFTELHQARLQRRRNLQPRVSRSGAFLALRPASMLLRDVNVSLIAEQMARGAPAIYCDLVDYDEVAHHAGPARPESMRQLESLDRMLGVLERLAPEAARRYHLVVLSDHGQSQGIDVPPALRRDPGRGGRPVREAGRGSGPRHARRAGGQVRAGVPRSRSPPCWSCRRATWPCST